jgi:3-oxoacyl-(acyl-carrier-protein) synthase
VTPRYVTGIGIVSALGIGRETFFRQLASATHISGLRGPTLSSFDATAYPDAAAVEVPAFDPARFLGDKGLRTLDRLTKLLVVAARLGLHDAGLKKDNTWVTLSPTQVGVCCSNAYGSLEAITELDRVAQLEDARYINPAKFPNTVSNSASGYVSIWEDLRALNVTVSDGNCGGLDVVGCTDVLLESQRADAILTGGGEALSEALFLAFDKLGVLAPTSSAPSPCLLSEGAAFLCLEDPDVATARGARVDGVICGYGSAFVVPAYGPLVVGSREGLARAIALAIEDAGVGASDIDLVVASLSGATRFDDEERAGIHAALGNVPVAAPKFLLGETLGASGAMAMAAGLAWMNGVPIAPAAMMNSEVPRKLRCVLVTSLGYYGNASAVVMRAADLG